VKDVGTKENGDIGKSARRCTWKVGKGEGKDIKGNGRVGPRGGPGAQFAKKERPGIPGGKKKTIGSRAEVRRGLISGIKGQGESKKEWSLLLGDLRRGKEMTNYQRGEQGPFDSWFKNCAGRRGRRY